MENVLKKLFRSLIKSLTGFDFERFILKMYLLYYGSEDFTPIREVKDQGSDGLIEPEKISISCYGPSAYNESDFKDKVDADFKSYQENWESNYPNWRFVVNHPVTPVERKHIEELKSGSQILGIEQIINFIESELDNYSIKLLAREVGIDEEYIVQDYISDILEDLLKDCNTSTTKSESELLEYKKPMYIPDKIEINFDEQDIEGAVNNYEILVEDFPTLQKIYSRYDDSEKRKIKNRILMDFNEFQGSFKEKIDLLTKSYLGKYSNENNDDYKFYIQVVIFYHFEQCLIGKRTVQEND